MICYHPRPLKTSDRLTKAKGSVEGAYKSAISQLEAKIDQGVWSSRKAG